MPSQTHEPVLVREVIEWLRPERGGAFVDCTVGPGGHAEAILTAARRASVIGIDRDAESLDLAARRLSSFGKRFIPMQANFQDLNAVLQQLGVASVAGVLADLGASSLQLESAERGFSFTQDSPLDMRMDRTSGETAAELIARLNEREIADLIYRYGEERHARRIARAIVRRRATRPVLTTGDLAQITVRAINAPGRWRIHPATRTFQALRIVVNQEIEFLEHFVVAAIAALAGGARLAIISFHSLEDRVVKQTFRRESGTCACGAAPKGALECHVCGATNRVRVLTPKPIRPGPEEVSRNPRARSARLRVCERRIPAVNTLDG